MAYAVILLSYTLITGEGGMISLCQVTFAGVGGVITAQLATSHGWPVLAAILAGALIATVVGLAIGFISTLLGDLYFALVTLTFGVLVDNLIFTLNVFSNDGDGVTVSRPPFATGDRAFSYLALGVFCVFALMIVNVRRSTSGLAIAAVRWSEPASTTMGIGVVQTKVLLTAFSAFVAGVGGSLLVLYNNNAIPSSFATLGGLVWLAVLVTVGVRSNVAAAVAGIGFALIPTLFVNYLPASVAEVPTALFGLGAILVTRYPDGTVAMHGRQLNRLGRKVVSSWKRPESPPSAATTVSYEASGEGHLTRALDKVSDQ